MKKLFIILVLLTQIIYAQECNKNIDKSAPNIRFQNDDITGLVKDLSTDLTWKRCSYGKIWDKEKKTCTGNSTLLTFQEALQVANSTDGFRLPNIKELASLAEYSCKMPSVNANSFNNIVNIYEEKNFSQGYVYLWSSTVNVLKEFFYFSLTGASIYSRSDLKQKAAILLVKE